MRRLLCLLLLLLAATARGQDLETFLNDTIRRRADRANAPDVKLDPKRIINQSNSFLKEKEPEMTGEEYALHENVVGMLETNPEFALKLLEGMMKEKETPSPAFEFILGNAYYSAGRVAEAEARYRSTVKRFPSFLRAWNNLGVLCYTAGRYADALPCFTKSLALGDRNATTYGLLGCCLEQTGDTIAAEQAFMQAIASDPDNSDWKDGLLRIYVQTHQYGAAETVARSLIRLRPTEARYWLTYANLLVSANRKNEAMVMLEVAATTKVAGPDELALLADLYAERNLTAEALRTYQALGAAAPQLGEKKLIRYAQMLTDAGRYAEAQKALDGLAATVSPASRAVYLEARASLYTTQQRWADARRELEALLALDPLNGRALLRLGRLHLAQDDPAHAQLAFEAAYRVSDTTYLASLELANLELKNRHYPKAVEYLEKALSIERSDLVVEFLGRVKMRLVENN